MPLGVVELNLTANPLNRQSRFSKLGSTEEVRVYFKKAATQDAPRRSPCSFGGFILRKSEEASRKRATRSLMRGRQCAVPPMPGLKSYGGAPSSLPFALTIIFAGHLGP